MNAASRVLSSTLGLALSVGLGLVGVPAARAAAPADAKKTFLSRVVPAAQQSQRQFGAPASVSIAEAIDESNWGTSQVAVKARNYFDTHCSAPMSSGQFATLAEAQVGKPYVLGAVAPASNPNPKKFDCSELVKWLFARSGNPITDLAALQYKVTKAVPKTASPQAGDLVFLRNNPARFNGIGHVAVLTKKLTSGDWEIIEARGHAYGVVKTTLSYWKKRAYYAGLRRYSSFTLAGLDGVTLAAQTDAYQIGCYAVAASGKVTRYRKYSSVANSFADHAALIAEDPAYRSARDVMDSVNKYISALAKIEHPSDADAYAKRLKSLITTYDLTQYDVAAFTIVLTSGDSGAKVTALQYLLLQSGYSLPVTGKFDSATVAAVKKFQSAHQLTSDGEAGPLTLQALIATLRSGATGYRVQALHALLKAIGYSPTTGATFGAATLAAVKAFQDAVDLPASGAADTDTWAKLFLALDPAPRPTISGSPTVDQTLTVAPGTWGPGEVNLSYQWYRNGAAVSGATGTSFDLKPADAGDTFRVTVTGSRSGYTTISRTSATTPKIAKATLTPTPTPRIAGKPTVDQTLTVDAGTWGPGEVDLAYQWYRGGTAIAGATGKSYDIQAADAGNPIKVAVTGSKNGYDSETVTSAATSNVSKATLATAPTPKVSGDATVDATLTADAGTWEPAGVALSYQWYRGKTAIRGATASTYKVQPGDVGAKLQVSVTGSKPGYTSVTKSSDATDAVAAATLTPTPTPTITGTPKSGKTLTVVPGTWGPGSVKLSFQWYRGTSAIKGATGKTYKVTSSDKGKTITVQVRGSRPGYVTVTEKASVKIG